MAEYLGGKLVPNLAEVSDAPWLTVNEICCLEGTFEGDREFYLKILSSLVPKSDPVFFPAAQVRYEEAKHGVIDRESEENILTNDDDCPGSTREKKIRYSTLGNAYGRWLLTVLFTVRANWIRVISARIDIVRWNIT